MIRITWLGHSTFQLELASGETYLLDPWIEGNPTYPEAHAIERVDAVLVSHGHFDHIQAAEGLAKKFSAPVVAIYEICQYLKSRGVASIAPMNKGGSQKVGPLEITMTHALHSSGIEDGGGNIVYAGDPAGFVLGFPDGRRAYFAGDTAVFGDMALIAELYSPELCFLPIGDLFTMGPREAAHAVKLLQPKTVIPMHWGTFPPLTGRPEDLAARVAGTGATVWTLEPGVTVTW
jgi:L-ascorbate metabolism protein UlaG (beta-lactamase superfamily)